MCTGIEHPRFQAGYFCLWQQDNQAYDSYVCTYLFSSFLFNWPLTFLKIDLLKSYVHIYLLLRLFIILQMQLYSIISSHF